MTPMDKGVVSRSVESLAKARLLKKQLHPHDGRRVTLELTAEGARIHEKIATRITQALSKVDTDDFDMPGFVDLLKKANIAIRR